MKYAWCSECKRDRLVFRQGTVATGFTYRLRRHVSGWPRRDNFSERVALNETCPHSGRRVVDDAVKSLW